MKLLSGFSLSQAQRGFWSSPEATRFYLMHRKSNRLHDLTGKHLPKVVSMLGWSYLDLPMHVAVMSPQGAVAAIGWAGLTTRGVNLSYACAKEFEGNGFATIATSAALVELDFLNLYEESKRYFPFGRQGVTVHAHYAVGNEASKRVALNMGLNPKEFFSIDILSGSCQGYQGCDGPLPRVLSAALHKVSNALEDMEDHETDRCRARGPC